MSAIQTAASAWVDSMAGTFSGGYGRNFKGEVMNAAAGPNLDDDMIDSMTSVISDVEEEGEILEPQEDSHPHHTIADTLSEEIAAGSDELTASDELVAAMAKHLEIIEATMRQHQGSGTLQFHDTGLDSHEPPTIETVNGSLQGDMLQDPATAFAATIPGKNRLGLIALLA
jgi:hypothetical protein